MEGLLEWNKNGQFIGTVLPENLRPASDLLEMKQDKHI